MNKTLIVTIGLLLLFGVGLGMRLNVLHAQYRAWGADLPFTLESAIQFRMIRTVFEQGELPPHDLGVEYPDGVATAETYTLGSERVYAVLARMMPQHLPLSDRVRLASTLVFCLGIPMLAASAGLLFRSGWAALAAGLFYACSAASVIRSTGQELSRENFALPWLLLFLLLLIFGSRHEKGKAFWCSHAGAGLALAMALVNWDMIQYAVGLWVLGEYGGLIFSTPNRMRQGRWRVTLITGILLVAAGVNPYLRSHGFFVSPLMMLAVGVVWAAWLPLAVLAIGNRAALRALVPWIPVVLVLWLGREYAGHYSHFAGLMKAKLVFGNVKPQDPSLLTFEQRIMWVPALHSASWSLTKKLFPATLILVFVAVCFHVAVKAKTPGFSYFLLFGCFLITLFAFILFVRFHTYLAIPAALLIGGWVVDAQRSGKLFFYGTLVLVAGGLAVEANNVLREPHLRWGRPNVYYQYQSELLDWLKQRGGQEPVLANFGISGSIITYADCPVILHPKFETERIRKRVESYGQHLFTRPEKAFRDWAEQHGARYYVYARGEFASIHPEYQMRYMVDALEPPQDAAVWVFKERSMQSRYFHYMWGNAKYRVFRVITGEDEALSEEYTALARQAYQHGDLDNALERATTAIELNPKQAEAVEIMTRVNSLKSKGVENLWQPNHETNRSQ